jgi:hypothetical protein
MKKKLLGAICLHDLIELVKTPTLLQEWRAAKCMKFTMLLTTTTSLLVGGVNDLSTLLCKEGN